MVCFIRYIIGFVSYRFGRTINEIHGQSIENLATKQDIESLRETTKKDLEMLKKDIIIKLGGLMVTGVGIIAILIKF